ncbi:hypothetical protein SCATT_00150 [Streptantibioticus cattleyicolor NRRL 8057 = DSM 46488]|uniref:Uncharacterized protein n=1 Tax=Streptantibioticus cattleyicolor (strain ATCC 35852 / DSM 46488 / JCM 4925 / NBRC 14057 / NRRL 8057) TaxID=1003195 RepID=G8WVU1_STREN|nr:hypothetical protein SCATT_00150 [Streptantibioticus cattleyicolor NRRL 8057 = DSM 46488]
MPILAVLRNGLNLGAVCAFWQRVVISLEVLWGSVRRRA